MSNFTIPGATSSSSASISNIWKSSDQKKKITFYYPDEDNIEQVAMKKDNAIASAHMFVGGFLNSRIDGNATIKEVSVFETPLKNLLGCAASGHHAFVLLYVKDYYVTFEKHKEGLSVQISKNSKSVVRQHMMEDRATPIQLMAFNSGVKTIQQLANFVAEQNFAFEEYNVPKGIHCKKFAGEVFKAVVGKQEYDWKSIEMLERNAAATATATVGVAVSAGLIFGSIPAAITSVGGTIITAILAIVADEERDSRKKEEPT